MEACELNMRIKYSNLKHRVKYALSQTSHLKCK